MNREHEQFAQSICTTESVINYLMDVKNMSENQVCKMIMDDEPTDEMIADLFENAIPEDEDNFYWGNGEYNR